MEIMLEYGSLVQGGQVLSVHIYDYWLWNWN